MGKCNIRLYTTWKANPGVVNHGGLFPTLYDYKKNLTSPLRMLGDTFMQHSQCNKCPSVC